MSSKKRYRFFKRLSLITLISVYALILIGGIVRSTGSGMGCPDWPKCFGSYVPPTDESQLPEGYKETYVEIRKQKNQRFAGYLSALGMHNKAERILHDEDVHVETGFNAFNTWTEYINRLVGAAIGFLIFGMVVSSGFLMKQDKGLFVYSLLAFLLVGFQGWIGSVVVSTNLMPWLISVHMVLALIIVLLLIYINFRARSKKVVIQSFGNKKLIQRLIFTGLLFMTVQIVLGTQVRESIDVIAAELTEAFRDSWVSRLGVVYLVHRSFSLVIMLLFGWLFYRLLKDRREDKRLIRTGKYLLILVLLEIMSGVMLAYLGMPPFVQPVHLLLSTLVFGTLYLMLLYSKRPEGYLKM